MKKSFLFAAQQSDLFASFFFFFMRKVFPKTDVNLKGRAASLKYY